MQLIVPLVAALGWLWWIHHMDRFDKAPWSLVLKTFGAGAAAGVGGLAVLVALLMLLPEDSSPILIFVGLVPVHVLAMTGVIYRLPFRRSEWNDPFDGLVYGGASGIGYGLTYTLWSLLDSVSLDFRSAVFSIPMFMLAGLIIGHYMSQVRFGPSDKAPAMWARGFLTASLFLTGIELAQAAGGQVLGTENPVASVVVYAANTLGWIIAMWAMDADKQSAANGPGDDQFEPAPNGCPSCDSTYPTGASYCIQCGRPVNAQSEVRE